MSCSLTKSYTIDVASWYSFYGSPMKRLNIFITSNPYFWSCSWLAVITRQLFYWWGQDQPLSTGVSSSLISSSLSLLFWTASERISLKYKTQRVIAHANGTSNSCCGRAAELSARISVVPFTVTRILTAVGRHFICCNCSSSPT